MTFYFQNQKHYVVLIVLSCLIIAATFILYKGYRVGSSPTSSVSLVSPECFMKYALLILKYSGADKKPQGLCLNFYCFYSENVFQVKGLGWRVFEMQHLPVYNSFTVHGFLSGSCVSSFKLTQI